MRHIFPTISLTFMLSFSTVGTPWAADILPLPADMNVVSQPTEAVVDYEEEPPETDSFEKAGFEFFRWQTWGPERDDVLRNIVEPDYKLRTGKELPSYATFDFVLQNVTGGKYNDVVVWSNLPGDCGPTGCKVFVFHMNDDGKWNVVADFHAITVMHRYASAWGSPIPELVAPGDKTTPTSIYRWNGEKFVER